MEKNYQNNMEEHRTKMEILDEKIAKVDTLPLKTDNFIKLNKFKTNCEKQLLLINQSIKNLELVTEKFNEEKPITQNLKKDDLEKIVKEKVMNLLTNRENFLKENILSVLENEFIVRLIELNRNSQVKNLMKFNKKNLDLIVI